MKNTKDETKEESTLDTSQENSTEAVKSLSLMASIIAESPTPPVSGDIIDGVVIDIDKSAVYVDLEPFGTGIIFGREFLNARNIIRKMNIGDTVSGKVVTLENEDGYIEISLKEARQALMWAEAEEAIRNKTVFDIVVQEANKGGLILSWEGIQGFLPASQLKTEHYPRVEDGDKDRILEELQKLTGETISVSVISADPKEGKLIFSEKNPEQKNKEKIIDNYQVGTIVHGEVTGIVDFGIFVKIEDGLEGLVHISEIDWSLVDDPKKLYSVGNEVDVKIIEIKEGKISLSIKALKKNPWSGAAEKYKKGDMVDAVVIKFNKHGALASIEEGVAGLVHISEFGDEEKMHEKIELGKSYPFKITLFDPKDQKMTLSFVNSGTKEKSEEKIDSLTV